MDFAELQKRKKEIKKYLPTSYEENFISDKPQVLGVGVRAPVFPWATGRLPQGFGQASDLN